MIECTGYIYIYGTYFMEFKRVEGEIYKKLKSKHIQVYKIDSKQSDQNSKKSKDIKKEANKNETFVFIGGKTCDSL